MSDAGGTPATTTTAAIEAGEQFMRRRYPKWQPEPDNATGFAWSSIVAMITDVAPHIAAQAAAAERERWRAAITRPGFCWTTCDTDCESGPVHCEWVHIPMHKPGWHAAEACPFADLLDGDDHG